MTEESTAPLLCEITEAEDFEMNVIIYMTHETLTNLYYPFSLSPLYVSNLVDPFSLPSVRTIALLCQTCLCSTKGT